MTRYVRVFCPCGEEWDDVMTYERDTGASYLGRDECPKCGADADELRVEDMDALDIQERKLAARGIDF